MRISKNIDFLNFKKKFNTKNIKSNFNKIISERNEVIESLKSSYKYSFSKKNYKKIQGNRFHTNNRYGRIYIG